MSLSLVIKYSLSANARAVFHAACTPMFFEKFTLRKTLSLNWLSIIKLVALSSSWINAKRRKGYFVLSNKYFSVCSVYLGLPKQRIKMSIGLFSIFNVDGLNKDSHP